MTTASQIKKAGDDKHWLVKNEQGETFGPVDFETLKLWAKDGRLAPTNTLSEDATIWNAITQYPALEMDWVAEVSPGAFYGPIHKLALEALQKEGALPANAVTFQRPLPVRSAAKTQPIAAICSVPPPPPTIDTDVLRALERQLDLERQRSHDSVKALQQVEARVAETAARAETAERALERQLDLERQRSHDSVKALQQVEARAAETAARAETAERALERQLDLERQRSHDSVKALQQVEERVAATAARAETAEKAHQHYAEKAEQAQQHLITKMESLLQDCMMRFGNQQQEILSVVTSTQPRVDVLPAKESSSSPSTVETQSILLAAIAQAQSHIVNQVTQQISDAVAQTQEQMRTTASSEHDQLATITQAQSHIVNQVTQHVDAALAQTQEQMRTTASATHERLDAMTQAQSLIVNQITQHMDAALKQTQEQMRMLLNSALLASQQDAASQTTQIVTQATAPITAHLTQHHQELERFGALINTSRTQTADAVVSAVAALLAKGREDLFKKIGSELAASHDQMFERTNTVLTHGREQMMRATGDSQRIAIENIVREFHASQQHVEAELKATLERYMKAVNQPVVERTYIKAEHVEVLPPERPHKKPHPEPEPAKPPPPPPAGNTGSTHATGAGLSMADIEQQARRELERLGAQGMNNIFKRK